MSLSRIPSALLPCLLWLSFLPGPVAATTTATDTAPPSSSSSSSSSLPRPPANNTTLLFASGSGLRSCSCSAPVSDCNEAKANLLCSCRTVPRSALPSSVAAGLPEPGGSGGGLTVWLRETWVLGELLNGSTVGHLRLALCGGATPPVAGQYLTLFGLRTLTVHSMAPGARHPYQELNLDPAASAAEGGSLSLNSLDADPLLSPDPPTTSSSPVSSSSSSAFVLRVTFLDVAVLNGLSALKAYSVVGPPVSNLPQEFPHLPLELPVPPSSSSTPEDGLNSLLTFVY